MRSPLTCHRCGVAGHAARFCAQPYNEQDDVRGNADWAVHKQRLAEETAAVGEIANLLRTKILRHRWPIALVHALSAAQKQEIGPLHDAEREQLEQTIKALSS
jgi:hypothetical protein